MITLLHDLLLPTPVPDLWLRFLMFFTFSLHFFFVLFMLGSALISLYYHMYGHITRDEEIQAWDKEMHRLFFTPKTVAVSLGTTAILVTQLYFGVPFYTSYVFFAPYWLSAFLAIIASFLLIEVANHKYFKYPMLSLVTDFLGVLILMGVPAIFVTILVGMEYTNDWHAINTANFNFPPNLMYHWLARYLHVIGASIVLGAGFEYLASSKGIAYRQRALMNWMVIGMLMQFVVGGMLALTLQEWLDNLVYLPLVFSIILSGIFLWFAFRRGWAGIDHPFVLGRSIYLLPLIIFGMLLTRQFIQNQKVLPLISALKKNAQIYNTELDPYHNNATATLVSKMRIVYDNGETIFTNSCSICHSLTGTGDSPIGQSLEVPPENLTQIRATRGDIYNKLVHGVPGSAMPYFSIYTKDKVYSIVDFLQQRFQVLHPPGPLPIEITPAEKMESENEYIRSCVQCHGMDGSGSTYAKPFKPQPPDFRTYNLSPQRAYQVITEGYPGTAMMPFSTLPENIRWGLTGKVNSFLTK